MRVNAHKKGVDSVHTMGFGFRLFRRRTGPDWG